MKTEVTEPRPDQLDAERFRDRVESPAFARFRARVQLSLERLRIDLERADADAVKTASLRGAIAQARMTLALPAQMLVEMKPKA